MKNPHRGDLSKLLDSVIGSKSVSKTDRDVLRELIRGSRWNGTATVLKETIATELEISTKTVQRAWRELEREKLIRRLVNGNNRDGRNHPTTYRFCEELRLALRSEHR